MGTLAAGGAIFIAALIIRASLLNTIDVSFANQSYDMIMRFNRPYPPEQIRQAIMAVPGVASVETGMVGTATPIFADGRKGGDVRFFTPPAATKLLDGYTLLAGRRFQPGDANTLITNQMWAKNAGVSVGDSVTLTIAGQATPWRLVGIVKQMTGRDMVFIPYEPFRAITGHDETADMACIVTQSRDLASLDGIQKGLERQMLAAGLDVLSNDSVADQRQILYDHMVVLTTFLVLMSGLVVAVGGLGLASTMSINVMERRRELGILRAVGASNGAILRIIVTEGALIGLISWVIAAAVAAPIGMALGNIVAAIMFEATLDFVFPPSAFLIWMGLVTILAAIASFYPAWNASQLTVHEVLAYE